MNEPKIFYRELDAFLAQIRIEKKERNFIHHILLELEKKFGERLNFHRGRLYEQRGRDLVLVATTDSSNKNRWAKKLSRNSSVAQLVGKNRSYIYDHAEVNAAFYSDQTNPQAPNAAIWVHSPDHEIVFVFELKDGWVREEMSLFLNTVRMSLNYRLFSDIMGGRLEQAVQIQKSLLPQKAPEIPGYQIIGCSRPAEIVGGDFYDYFELDEGLFGVSLGDASGHGIPAALLVRDVVTGLRMGLAKEMRMVHTIKKLNHVIQRSTYSTSFVSVFVGEIEWDGHLFYCNAGHPGPFLVHKNRAQNLSATGITLGFMPEIELHRAYAKMERNSVLVIYSDGIFERRNEEGEQFGLERLQELVIKNQNKRAEGILEIVFNTVYDFGNRTNWEDDATVVVIKRL